jgi:hypothetical protein
VSDAGHDDAIEVGEHLAERLDTGGRVLGECGADVAGLHLTGHWVLLDVLQVLGDPVDECVAVLAEVVGSHRAKLLPGPRRSKVSAVYWSGVRPSRSARVRRVFSSSSRPTT